MSTVKISKLGRFDLNPRGNLWFKDENRFGHKLLSKMGWSQGKGLGKNENGISENLKVKMKSGNTGVGWSEKFPLQAEHKEYDAILANLNDKFNSENKTEKEEDPKSLVLRSQEFKKRLHYGKFVRGKDVCRYSEKDMNSIFVKKKPEPPPVKSTVTNIESSSIEDEISEDTSAFKSHLNMKDYFEMKMKKKTGNSLSNIDVTNIKSEENTRLKELSSKKKGKQKKLDCKTSEGSSSDSSISSTDVTEVKKEEDTWQREVSNKKKSKNQEMELDLQTSEELSSDASVKNEGDATESRREVSNKRKSKSKKLQLDPQSSGESSSDGHSMDCSVNETGHVQSSSDKKALRKRSRAKNNEKCNGIKLKNPEIVEVSSDEEEVQMNCNSHPEESSVKQETSSRKRSKAASVENSKRIKLDPDLVNGFPCTNSIADEDSDITKVSHPDNKSSIATGESLVNEVPKKKKKAEKRKRAGTEVMDISEESTSPESSEKEFQEDLVLIGEFPQSEIQVLSRKIRKTKKPKLGPLTKLKTCLKGSTNYSLVKESKRVSFNEHVFYRTIKSDTEKTDDENEPDVSKSSTCETSDDTVKEVNGKDLNGTGVSDVKNGLCNGVSSQCNGEGKPDVNKDESEEVPSCMILPKCSKSNYNSWLENQRLATKMRLYQNMIKKIKKHPVLKTSNLLDLKGYGNWGF